MAQFKFEQNEMEQSSSKEDIVKLFENRLVEIDLKGWWNYEENIEYDKGEFTFDNGDVLTASGYHGIYEILSFNNLSPDAQQLIQDQLLDNMLWYYDDI